MKVTADRMEALCDIAVRAGGAVMQVYATDFSASLKDDASPVTEADLRADAVIRDGLNSEFRGAFVVSEESAPSLGEAQSYFLVDPLDGTKEFLSRNGEFTVNIALVESGAVVAGVVYAPALETVYFASTALGARKRVAGAESELRVGTNRDSVLRVIGSRSHGGPELSAWLESLDREYEFVAAGSSLKFCRIAEGAADIYPRFGPTNQWDTAAAQCVLEQAGGLVTDMRGEVLRYGTDRPLRNPWFVAMRDRQLASLMRPASAAISMRP